MGVGFRADKLRPVNQKTKPEVRTLIPEASDFLECTSAVVEAPAATLVATRKVSLKASLKF